MIRKFAPFVVGIGGGVAAILTGAAITGPILRTVHDGGSAWWLLALFTPALIAAVGICAAARIEHVLDRRDEVIPWT